MVAVAVYLVLGVFVGIMAGLLGVGGGVVIVPVLSISMVYEGVNDSVIHHMALATSMGSIMFTSVSSALSHNRRGTVRWDIVKAMTPGLLLGTLAGTFIVSGIPAKPLKIVFAAFLTYTATQMILDLKPKAAFRLPGPIGLLIAGACIGLFASFVGIGGGLLITPFLLACAVPMLNTIGASAAMGFPIAVAGTIGFIYHGWGNPALPEYSLGFIYLPALVGLVITSMLAAPYGARLSHVLPVRTLKKCFGVILAVVAVRMIYSVL